MNLLLDIEEAQLAASKPRYPRSNLMTGMNVVGDLFGSGKNVLPQRNQGNEKSSSHLYTIY
jgi:5-methyltetrahydrofolate--homocysteine methyltransferase